MRIGRYWACFDPYYSNTVSKTSEDIKYGTIDAGYNVFNEASYKVTPFAGYTVLSQYMKANGCQPNAGNDVVCWNGDTNAPGLPTSQLSPRKLTSGKPSGSVRLRTT